MSSKLGEYQLKLFQATKSIGHSMRNNAFHSTYLKDKVGHATVTPNSPCIAGEFASFTLTYTAGYFGIDDTGSLKIVHRFASDMGKMQFTDPKGWNYVTAEASNGALLELRYDQKGNIRPWDKTLLIRVQLGFLREGDQIVIRIGDQRQGSPGIRVQTFTEPTFEFKVLVDAFATYNYVELPNQPTISIVAGPAVLYKALLPTERLMGAQFKLGFKGEDRWGNPAHQVKGRFFLHATLPTKGLPEYIDLSEGSKAHIINGLSTEQTGELIITITDASGLTLCRSNPLRISSQLSLQPFWADLHGQSEETIGTNGAKELIEFAKDIAFLDVMSHQGNDFQITTPFWQELNRLTAQFNKNGEFVIFPGYEWSGNTGLGGDRNVMFMKEGRQIHRSHHALVEDMSDVETDANSAVDLFKALESEDCVVFAHIGGRYADITMAHDSKIERSVEVHSDWGTFEWLLQDAFEQGYRVGILANSDGHKGRHGASHPGASLFGAYGGLSCLLAKDLSRESIFAALRNRHHYATTGTRAYLSTKVNFKQPASLYNDDPNMGGTVCAQVTEAMMGDILSCKDETVTFEIEVSAGSPIERIEIRNRTHVIETWRPYGEAELGSRIRIIWEGSEYRGRGRQTVWDGQASFQGNEVLSFTSINMWNLDKQIHQPGKSELTWKALTTGGFGGADIVLKDPKAGAVHLKTPLIDTSINIQDIGLQDIVLTTGGGIQRQARVFRLPNENSTRTAKIKHAIQRNRVTEDALYVRVTLEDGHFIWSSPIYLLND